MVRKEVYTNSTSTTITYDYIDGFVYQNNTLSYFPTAEGRVRNSSGVLTFEYFIRDNLGNVRVSFDGTTAPAIVRQENSYYPFGMTLPGNYVMSQPNNNLFNGGSEWQNDFSNLPDFYQAGVRNYDAELGRFIAIDAMAGKVNSLSPYQYAGNNPIGFNDPTGLLLKRPPEPIWGGNTQTQGEYVYGLLPHSAEDDDPNYDFLGSRVQAGDAGDYTGPHNYALENSLIDLANNSPEGESSYSNEDKPTEKIFYNYFEPTLGYAFEAPDFHGTVTLTCNAYYIFVGMTQHFQMPAENNSLEMMSTLIDGTTTEYDIINHSMHGFVASDELIRGVTVEGASRTLGFISLGLTAYNIYDKKLNWSNGTDLVVGGLSLYLGSVG